MHHPDSFNPFAFWKQGRMHSNFNTAALLFVMLIGLSFRGDAAPIVLSYYWPVAKEGELDSGKLALNAVTHIDVLSAHIEKHPEAYEYWRDRGVIILNRVYPFRVFDRGTGRHERLTTYEEIYTNFEENIKAADGISVDELLGGGRGDVIDAQRREIMIRVLGDLRRRHPDKLISVWGSAEWDNSNIPLLQAINQYCDFFVPQIYIPVRDSGIRSFAAFNRRLARLETQANGISRKTLIGLGLHEKMGALEAGRFINHIRDQLLYIFTDDVLGKLPGVAFYAPNFVDHATILTLDATLKSAADVKE